MHLIDLVLSFPMLKAILQSVTHNLSQVRQRSICAFIALRERKWRKRSDDDKWRLVLSTFKLSAVDINHHDDADRHLLVHSSGVQLLPQVLRVGRRGRGRRARQKVSQHVNRKRSTLKQQTQSYLSVTSTTSTLAYVQVVALVTSWNRRMVSWCDDKDCICNRE